MDIFKSGFVSVIGRPSAGKSTLLNALCGFKVSIVSSVPQTTRNKIRGIVNTAQGQIVFVDTPGYHISDKKMNQYLNDVTENALNDTEAVLYVVDATREAGDEEKNAAKLAQSSRLPLVIAVNKVDLVSDKGEKAISTMREWFPETPIFPISALAQEGLEDLLQGVFAILPEGEPMYPDEYVTDQPPEFRISEIIREKAVNRLSQEIPHALYVEIADLEENDDNLWIRAFLVVERNSQVGIVVGKKGEMINKIRTLAKREIKQVFQDRNIRLELQVKVRGKWRKDDKTLNRLFKMDDNDYF